MIAPCGHQEFRRVRPLRPNELKTFIACAALIGGVLAVWAFLRASQSDVPVVWECRVPWLSLAPVATTPDGMAYVRNYGGEVIAIDGKGKTQWTADYGGIGSEGPAVIAKDGTIYIHYCPGMEEMDSGVAFCLWGSEAHERV